MTTTPKRRWPRFTLRTLFVVVTVIGVAAGWLAFNLRQVHNREAILARLGRKVTHGVSAELIPGPSSRSMPFTWRLLGAKPMAVILFNHEGMTETECHEVEQAFPEAEVRRADSIFTVF